MGNSNHGGMGQQIGTVRNVRYNPHLGLDVVEVNLTNSRTGTVPDNGRSFMSIRSTPPSVGSRVRFFAPPAWTVWGTVTHRNALVPGFQGFPTMSNMTIIDQVSFPGESGAALVWNNGSGEVAIGTLVGGGWGNDEWGRPIGFSFFSQSNNY